MHLLVGRDVICIAPFQSGNRFDKRDVQVLAHHVIHLVKRPESRVGRAEEDGDRMSHLHLGKTELQRNAPPGVAVATAQFAAAELLDAERPLHRGVKRADICHLALPPSAIAP